MKGYNITLTVSDYAVIRQLVDGYDGNDLSEMGIDYGDYNLAWQALVEAEQIELPDTKE